jgi:MarR family transcriptional regulator, negative regulator of the multidrug operon emrRAB
MSRMRTANLLGALSTAVSGRLAAGMRTHPNQGDASTAALRLLATYDGCSNAMLSQALELSHSATVRLVDKLEEAGLVISRQGADRRSVALALTPTGRDRARSLLEARCRTLEDVVAVLSPEQREQLDQIASTILREMTTSPTKAAHICRLCDEIACPPARCPVHRRAHELLDA